MASTYYKRGSWKCCCDVCGKVFKSNQLVLRWDGARVCSETCFEIRHPQELLRMPRPQQAIPWARNCESQGGRCLVPANTRVLNSKLQDRISSD